MDSRKFQKMVKSLFPNKPKSRNTITFVKDKNTEVSNSKIADIL